MKKTALYTKTAISALILSFCIAIPQNGISNNLILKKGDRVAIVGDSITQQKQYSKFIEIYLLASVPQLDLTMYQFGWSGERTPAFAARMDNDMIPWKPTVVTTCYGMNDGSYTTYTDRIGKIYKDHSNKIQTRCKELGIRMVVGGPGPVDTDTWRPNDPDADLFYNDNLGKLSEIAGQLAAENGFVYAKLHPLMMQVMKDAKAKRGNSYYVAGKDGVHPHANGHLIMAYAFLKAMGLDGAIGTITVDMTGKTTATDGHRVLAVADGAITIESSRYPFCFYGKETEPSGTASILPFLPFNKDLNRYMLLVNNLSAPMADITWGKTTKTFTKAELEAGINLADQFRDNPFSKSFFALDRIIAQKQNRETYTIKNIITNLRWLESDFSNDEEVINISTTLRRKLLERNAQDAIKARAAVKPVTHTIQITPKNED